MVLRFGEAVVVVGMWSRILGFRLVRSDFPFWLSPNVVGCYVSLQQCYFTNSSFMYWSFSCLEQLLSHTRFRVFVCLATVRSSLSLLGAFGGFFTGVCVLVGALIAAFAGRLCDE